MDATVVRTVCWLQVETADGTRAAVGAARASVGRAGQVHLGDDDVWMPAIAFYLQAVADVWVIEVPPDKREVDVLTGYRDQVWKTARPGERVASSLRSARLRVRTSDGVHRLAVVFYSDPVMPVGSSDTLLPCAHWDLARAQHRAILVACEWRLDDANAGAMSAAEVADRLSVSPDTARRRLGRAVREVADWMGDAGLHVHALSRDRAVDWLVPTGTATHELLEHAVRCEKEHS